MIVLLALQMVCGMVGLAASVWLIAVHAPTAIESNYKNTRATFCALFGIVLLFFNLMSSIILMSN